MASFAPSRRPVRPRPSLPSLSARDVALGALLGLPATLALVVALLAVWQVYYRDAIYPYVTANGVDVGGLTPAAARERLNGNFLGYAEQPLTIRAEGRSWSVTPARLGLQSDTARLAEEAFRVGRDGSPIERLLTPVRIRNGTSLQARPTLTVDARERVIAQIAADVDRVPVDARLETTAAGVTVRADEAGRRLNREQAVRRLTGAIEQLRRDPIDLAVEPVPAAVTAASLQPVADRARAIVDRPVVLTPGDRAFALAPGDIREALRFGGEGANTRIEFDTATLRRAVSGITSETDRPARAASLAIREGRPVFDPGQPGLALQVDQTVTALRDALQTGSGTVPIAVKEIQPAVSAASYEAARRDLEVLLSGPVVARARGQEWTISAPELGKLVTIVEPAKGKPAAVVIDEAGLTKLVTRWAETINVRSVSPKLDWNGGNVLVAREGRRGSELQLQEAVTDLAQAARSDSRTVDLPVATWGTDVTQATVGQLGIRELVSEASTPYAGSIPERANNVELAARRLNGTVVAPGEKFSFNRAVGPTTTESGFKWGFGIVNTGNGLATVPSVAGGICQVATTLFQPVFWGGFPIDERLPHSYWISKYASRGLPGLDAAVDEESGLDFRFTNNSPNYLLIQAWTAGEKLSFALYGTKPDWDVKVAEPVISNKVKADTATVKEPSDWLPVGETLATERAEDGFDVTVTRTVTDKDGKARKDSFTSRYQPSRNVVLVGTGKDGGKRAQGR